MLLVPGISSRAQIPAVRPGTQLFGVIDTADLKLTDCDFEKGANAMVLFDRAEVSYRFSSIIMERHKRIKIFKDQGKDEANIRIEYYGVHKDEEITDVEAETINFDNNTINYTKIDKQLIYDKAIDKERRELVFTFPNVKPGSVVEFKYKWITAYPANYPDWFFQSNIPVRYSEFDASFNENLPFEIRKKIYQPAVKDTAMKRTNPRGTRQIWALANIKSYTAEPFMDYPEDYLQRVTFGVARRQYTWADIGKAMLADDDFGGQLTTASLNGEAAIIAKANSLKAPADQIKFLFDTVRNAMKWNETDAWYTVDGVRKAWNKKTGNSAEINLALFHLLKSVNFIPYLMCLKNRERGAFNPDNPRISQLNTTIVYLPVDSANYYVLDASDKYNSYNNIPYSFSGLTALTIDPDRKLFGTFHLKPGSSREVVLVNGSISADGRFSGSTQISSNGYSRKIYLEQYEKQGEKKYTDALQKKGQ